MVDVYEPRPVQQLEQGACLETSTIVASPAHYPASETLAFIARNRVAALPRRTARTTSDDTADVLAGNCFLRANTEIGERSAGHWCLWPGSRGVHAQPPCSTKERICAILRKKN